jgi:peptidoglycan/xylan/chitin deacetylase (PgdA/CDA1 family)
VTSPAPLLTTVMYHYVRPVAQSAFPRLKALELTDFTNQLNYLQAQYTVIGPHDLRRALIDKRHLPAKSCLLTFDDGYSDHYQHVYPILAQRGMSGIFFAPRCSLIDRCVLDVNKVQFTLANHPDPDALAGELDTLLAAEGVTDTQVLRAKHFTPNRYDGPSVAYFKRLLQHALPYDLRKFVTTQLFRRHVSADERDFAEQLYLTQDQAREMRAGGMEFGGHGNLHLWHGEATPDELAQEIGGACAALAAIGAPVQDGFYSYPFGSETDLVRTGISNAGFRIGFTVKPDVWATSADPLRVARLDTNDLPLQNRPNCQWLAKVE